MGLLSTEVLGGVTVEVTGDNDYSNSSVKEFSNIIRKIIPEALEEKYVRLEHLIGLYQDIVIKMNSNNKDLNRESHSEEKSREELDIYIKKLNDIETEIITNEKMIASIPYTDMSNVRNGLINKNYNLFAQRINLQKKVTFANLKINKSLYTMNNVHLDSNELMNEVSDMVTEISELIKEIQEIESNNISLDKLRIAPVREKQIFDLIQRNYSDLSIYEIKEKFMSLILFLQSYFNLKKIEYFLVLKTAEEIKSEYNNRELLPEDYDSFNLLGANKLLTAPLYVSDTIMNILDFGMPNKKNMAKDTNELSTAFMIMADLLKSRYEDRYTVNETENSVNSLRNLKPKNSTIESLIYNPSIYLERKEIEKNKEMKKEIL